MTDIHAKRLRRLANNGYCADVLIAGADRIEWLQDVIARIQYTNLRRDMNIETRTKEIDRMCKEKTK